MESPKRIVDNNLRGYYGETDVDRGVIRINKKRHYSKSAKRITPASDGHEKIISTMLHEETHFKHPRMHEKTVRQKEKWLTKHLSRKQKSKLYAKYS